VKTPIPRIPDGESGPWAVKRVVVSEEDASWGRVRAIISSSALGRFCPAGTYTLLKRDGKTIMSDTPDELRDLFPVRRAEGRVLIAGLGLGCAVCYAFQNPSVTSVTVIEKSRDVISLVAPAITKACPDVRIINGDILTWKPAKGESWDFGWYDIWDNIDPDNLAELTKIKRRLARRVKTQKGWAEDLCRQYVRRKLKFAGALMVMKETV
jgi:hypothetical protein